MNGWLVGRLTFFSVTGQKWMLVADIIILASIAFALWRRT
jgi:hypothetical protein